jgi:hypothetical protein
VIEDPTRGVFGSYNARSTSPELVAAGFVAPPQFWSILPSGNSVLTGPRGSGKTTLLKMLTVPGLESWDDERADEASAIASYSGVFVPADRSWAGQVEMLGRRFDDQLRSDVGNAAFVLHCLRALVLCARSRVDTATRLRAHQRVTLEQGIEEDIARGVWAGWGFGQPAGSLYGLQIGLSDEISALGRLVRGAARSVRLEEQLREHPALNMELIEVALPFIERFNHAAGDESHVWAFLIDEIEFLPPGIQGMLTDAVRGRDPRIIQKVSIAPYTVTSTEQLETPLGGWEGHDLQRVDLTFSEKEQGYVFSRQLVEKEIQSWKQDQGGSRRRSPSVRALLGGEGFFERPPGADAYGPGSVNAKAIGELARIDSSFAAWLSKHRIDPERPGDVTGVKRSKTLQKAIAIILLRHEFLHGVRGELQGRSRKNHRIYIGEEAVFAICENNPRLLKALVGKLLALHNGGRLRDGTRAETVQESCREYRLHLRAIEVESAVAEALLPRRFVDAVGGSFAAAVYGDQFDPEPALAFEVSGADRTRRGLSAILTQLTHYGAIVPLEENKYRLAHMFAPLYRLPLRKGRVRALGPMLAPERNPEQLAIEQEQL